MSVGAFPPLEFYEIVWEAEMLVLLGMFGKFHLWSHLVHGFCLWGIFFITASISLDIICLFRFSDSSWFCFRRLYVSRNLFISSRLSNFFWYIIVCSIFLQSFVFLWCLLLFLLFHFWFYLFGFSLSLSLCLSLSLSLSLFDESGLLIFFIFSKS